MTELVNKTTLDNGLIIITEKIPTVRSVSTGYWVKVGSRYETEKQAGITHFLEHTLFKGTKKRSAFDLASAIESRGGFMNALTSNEYTAYYVRCLDSEIKTAMDVLSDMILNPVFPAEELEKEKKVVIEEMKMYRDSPEDSIFEEFIAQIFKNHPLGLPIIGNEDSVNSFNRDTLYEFMGVNYQPENLIFAVAGNVEHDEVVSQIKTYFNGKTTTSHKRNDIPLTKYEKQISHLEKPIEQAHLILGRRALSSTHPDRYKLLLMNTILGGGMSSRLHQNIREKYGYCYAINSNIQSYHDTGFFAIYTGTDKEHLEHSKELVFAELDKFLLESITENELENAKTQLKGLLLLGQENMGNRMTRLAKSEMYYGRYVSLDETVSDIDAVNRGELNAFCADFLRKEEFTETELNPTETDEE